MSDNMMFRTSSGEVVRIPMPDTKTIEGMVYDVDGEEISPGSIVAAADTITSSAATGDIHIGSLLLIEHRFGAGWLARDNKSIPHLVASNQVRVITPGDTSSSRKKRTKKT